MDTNSIPALNGDADGPLRRRPIGIALLSLVLFLGGLWVAWQRFYPLIELFSTAEGPVTMSGPFKVALLGDGLYAASAIAAAFGLIIGAKWGWWLGSLHWTWRLSRYVFIPAVASAVGMPGHDEFHAAKMVGPFLFSCLMLVYLFKRSVIAYLRLESLNKTLAVVALFVSGIAIAFVLDPLRGPLGLILEDA